MFRVSDKLAVNNPFLVKAFGLLTGPSQIQKFDKNLDKQGTGVPEAPFCIGSSV